LPQPNEPITIKSTSLSKVWQSTSKAQSDTSFVPGFGMIGNPKCKMADHTFFVDLISSALT